MKKNLRIVSAAAAALLAVAPVAATAIATPATTVSAAVSDDTTTTATISASKPLYSRAGSNAISTSATIDAGKVVVSNEPVRLKAAFNGQEYEFYEILKGDHKGYYLSSTDIAHLSTSVPGDKVDNSAYFTDNDGQALSNHAVVASPAQNRALFETTEGNNRSTITIAEVKAAVENVVSLRDAKGNKLSFKKNVWGNSSNVTTDQNLAAQLKAVFGNPIHNDSVEFANDQTAFNVDNHTAPFSLRITAISGDHVDITFQNTSSKNTVSPVVYGYYRTANGDRAWSKSVDRYGNVRPLVITQNDLGNGSAWNPSDYLRADANENTKGWINASYQGNVDLTKAGIYNVTVTATNAANHTTTVTVPVIVDATNGKIMTLTSATPVYNISGTGANATASVATNFTRTLAAGSQVHVYGSVVTAKLNGQDTQFYRVVSPNANYYVPASALKDGVVSTPAQETTRNVTIMHIAAIYDKNGKKTNESSLRAYDSVAVVSDQVTINGAKFYKLAGKDQYIKVGNVDGTKRTLKKASYVYKNTLVKNKKHGKVTNKKLAAGSTVTTYGKSFMIKGHQVYRIGKNQYVKKANF